jgi:Flp pilus assembly protein TadB
MLPAGFKPAIPDDERPRTYTIQRAATGFGTITATLVVMAAAAAAAVVVVVVVVAAAVVVVVVVVVVFVVFITRITYRRPTSTVMEKKSQWYDTHINLVRKLMRR